MSSSTSSIRTQTYTYADAPRVLLYDNYVMFDRFMNYRRFNRTDCRCCFLSDQQEIRYYRNNYHNFLVLKFSRTTNEIILFDTVHEYLYTIGNPIHTHEVSIHKTFSEWNEREIYHISIAATHDDAYCLNMQDGYFCPNKQDTDINNGYCRDCQHNALEFDDIDVDRLLTYNEFVSLPEFAAYPYFDNMDREDDDTDDEKEEKYNHDNHDNHDNNNNDTKDTSGNIILPVYEVYDGYRRYSDTDFSDNDYDDRAQTYDL